MEDNNSPYRPKKIKVNLLKNGKVIQSKVVSEATMSVWLLNGWNGHYITNKKTVVDSKENIS